MNFLLTFLLVTTSLYAATNTTSFNKTSDTQTINRFISWQNMKESAKDKKVLDKLKIVNDYFNKLEYTSDLERWKKNDYWASPYEFLKVGSGDCEDYAIAKYFTLKELGIKENKLKLTYARLSKSNQAHIVLSYYHKPNYIPIILDNINKNLQKSTKRKDLKQLRIIDKEVIYSKVKLQTNDRIN